MTRRSVLAGLAFSAPASRTPVLIDHDGGYPEDYMAVALVAGMEHIRLLGVVVTEADCFVEPAASATRKLLGWMKQARVPVAKSGARGRNPFPKEWREGSITMDRSPRLAHAKPSPLAREDGAEFLATTLRASSERVTLLVTGPLSTVAAALDLDPGIAAKIREIVWMGGAVDAPGNVRQPEHDGSAEWNAYWDPPAAARVWRSEAPIVLCPLDCTNQAPLVRSLADRIASLRSPAGRLAAECYADKDGRYLWDEMTAAYLGRPELFSVREREVEIIAEGPSQGRTAARAGARKIRVMEKVHVAGLHDYLISQWDRRI